MHEYRSRTDNYGGAKLKGKMFFCIRSKEKNTSHASTPGFPFSPSLFYWYNLPLLCLSSQGSILQGCYLSLATFSLRKCCIRLVANRAVTKLEYQWWRRPQQKQKHQEQASLWGYIVTLQCFYLLQFWHFHLFTHTETHTHRRRRRGQKEDKRKG